MNKSKIIESTDTVLKDIPRLQNEIRAYKNMLNNEQNDITRKEFNKNKNKLNYIINVIKDIPLEQQRLIGYKYFEGKTNKDISILMGYSTRTITRNLEKAKLAVGRVLFGMEDEFWNEIYSE
jgi:DNA-directed RNA polymerase specialized sigma24 family protein